jgi:hypothetical protein
MDEYERMLSTAAETADEARRTWERQVNSASSETFKNASKDRQAHAGAEIFAAKSASRSGASSTGGGAGESKPIPYVAPLSLAGSLPKSSADKRAQLLGVGGGSRFKGGGRAKGVQAEAGGRAAHEQLTEDRKHHERLEEELSKMTRALKSNVEAMHATLVQDNAKLDQIDSDIIKGQSRLTKVNLNVDEQRIANRYGSLVPLIPHAHTCSSEHACACVCYEHRDGGFSASNIFSTPSMCAHMQV